jgi:hypothetical protein
VPRARVFVSHPAHVVPHRHGRCLADRQRKQIPFALKEVVNDVALKAQAAERAHVAEAFTNRRPDFLKCEAVKVVDGFFTKQRPSITLGPSDKADFLRKFEEKSVKTPSTLASSAGPSLLAIPVDARRNTKDIITAKNRPRALLNSKAAQTTAAGTGRVFIVRPAQASGVGPYLAPDVYQRRQSTLKMLFKL